MKELSTEQKNISIFGKFIVRVLAGLVILISFHTHAVAGKKVKSFIIFNSINYNNTPDLSNLGLQPINLIYENNLLKKGLPDNTYIRNEALNCLNKTGVPVTLDIESWSFDAQHIATTIKYYLQTIDNFKKTNNKSQLGFYGVVPQNIIYNWKNISTNANEMNNWLQLNVKLKPVADRVDIFFPAFYTYNEDTTAWKEAVTATIKEIKKYNKNKPVYGYIWPQFHTGTSKQLQFIDPKIWNFELETLYNLTDGVVIWTNDKDAKNNTINWNAKMPWWKTTLAFMQRHELIKQSNSRYTESVDNPDMGIENCTVYPNPAKDDLMISWENDVDSQLSANIALYNINGQILINTTVPFNQGNAQLSLKEVPAGLYFCILYCGDKKFVTKVSVIK